MTKTVQWINAAIAAINVAIAIHNMSTSRRLDALSRSIDARSRSRASSASACICAKTCIRFSFCERANCGSCDGAMYGEGSDHGSCDMDSPGKTGKFRRFLSLFRWSA